MTEEVEWPRTVVIDNGTFSMKAGFAEDEAPTVEFSSIIKRRKQPSLTSKNYFINASKEQLEGIAVNTAAMANGVIVNWDMMESIWRHIFYEELKVEPERRPMLLTEAISTPKANREKMTQIMFETFSVPELYIGNQSTLSLFAAGKVTGVSVNIGEGASDPVVVYEGCVMTHTVQTNSTAGIDVTLSIDQLLKENGYDLPQALVREIKEKLSYVAYDYDEEVKESQKYTSKEKSFELPDGNILTLNSERFKCAEVLFQPNLLKSSSSRCPGIHELTYNSIMKSDVSVRYHMYSHIVLSGGCSMIENIAHRMHREMFALSPCGVNLKVDVAPEGRLAAWIGGSILGSLSTFKAMAISKDLYEEVGPTIVHRKCL